MDPRYLLRQQSYGTISQGLGRNEFNVAEFHRICETVATNILTIREKTCQLEDISTKALGTQWDKVHAMQKSANQIITQTSTELMRLNNVSRSDRQRKLQIERMRGDFKITVQRYSDVQKKMVSKIKSHVIPNPDSGAEDDSGTYDTSEYAQLLAAQRWHRQQKELIREVQFEYDALEERSHVQQNSTQHNPQQAHGGVECGVEHLHKTSIWQRKYCKKLCFLFAIIVAIVTGLVIVLVTQLK